MMNAGWISQFFNQQPSSAKFRRTAVGAGVAILLLAVGVAVAQNPTSPVPEPGPAMSIPSGYSVHSSVDAGGRITNLAGSNAMYNTLVNLQTGPRLMGQTFLMRALPGNKNPLLDNLSEFSAGYGGEPYNFTKLDVNKGKYYEFFALFRRDRQYADYNLIGNPNIPSGYSIPIGPSTAPTAHYAWPQVTNSPFLFNTVRRMTDINLTLLPVSKVTFRFAYSKNVFQGPSRTPSGYQVGGSYSVILQEYQRHSTDDYTGGIDWKPVQGTQLTFEEQVDHYKGDSYFTQDPTYFTVQEANGIAVALLDSYQTPLPYGYSSSTAAFAPASNCNATSMINYAPGPPASGTILYANPHGLPIIDPACAVLSSYFRSQPTRELFPTEIFRLQSSSIKHLSMNGNARYTHANMNLPTYYDAFSGLTVGSATTTPKTQLVYTGVARAVREVFAVDYGIVWRATKKVSLEDQVNYSNVHQPGTAAFTSGTTVAITSGVRTINNNTGLTTTNLTAGSATFEGSPAIGSQATGYFGQRFVINNATLSWNATPRSTFSLTYRYGNHIITEGANISVPVQFAVCPSTVLQPFCGTVTINENGGIFNAALRPASNWELNGTVEVLYDDNVFTPVAPRQTQHYRVHTLYRPKPWATISAAYNDLERHNNTNNQPAGYWATAAGGPMLVPPALDHMDHTRVVSLATALYPNEHYGFDFSYAYSDVYTSTNTCFQAAATLMPALTPGGPTTVVPGAAFQTPGTTTAGLCALVAGVHGVSIFLGPTRDFADAPTQYGSAAVALSPGRKIHSDLGYRISSVDGSRFFNQAQDVNGTLLSTYQSPFASLAYTMHPGLALKADYNYYGYGEGGQSGAAYCNNNPAIAPGYPGATIPVVPCNTVGNTTMSLGAPVFGFTAPRNFHANNVLLGIHYEF